jgi:hypothetical protein
MSGVRPLLVSNLRLLSPLSAAGAAVEKLPNKTKADAKAVAALARIVIPSLIMISPRCVLWEPLTGSI